MTLGFLGKIASTIEKINEAKIKVESFFYGLPHVHTSLVKSLINVADPINGYVTQFSYQNLIDLLEVNRASGRSSIVIQKQTIRSYLRTVEKFCPEHFQVASEGQQLIIKFPTLPSIYAECFKNIDMYIVGGTDLRISKNLDNTDQKTILDSVLNTEEYTEPYTDLYIGAESAKNNNIFNINKKQQHTTHAKLPISDNFYPSDKTIASALAKGFSSVTCPIQIKKFIDYNKARGSVWADYNPIFLKWLEQDLKRNTQSNSSQGECHERYTNKPNKSKPTLQDVINANRDALSPDGERYDDVLGWVVAEEIPRLALDTDVTDIRAVIY